MFNLELHLRLGKPKSYFRSLFFKTWKLSEHKFLEIETYFSLDGEVAVLVLNIEPQGRDHAGARFAVSLFGLNFEVTIYDHRHWDHETNNWVTLQEQDDK